MIRCSLCDQEFDENDSLIKIRKEKHQHWHDFSTYLSRGSKNTVFGKVVWT